LFVLFSIGRGPRRTLPQTVQWRILEPSKTRRRGKAPERSHSNALAKTDNGDHHPIGS
jgi:hypothetical protein